MNTLERIKKLLNEHKDIDMNAVSMDTKFSDLGLDSLDIVELVMVFEEEFGVSITMDESLNTVGAFVELIDKA